MKPLSAMPEVGAEESAHLAALRDAFGRFTASSAARGEPAWLTALRKEHLTSFLQTGYPTRQNEHWRHTSLTPLASLPFSLAGQPPDQAPARELVGASTFQPVPGFRWVFINGQLAFPPPPRGALRSPVSVSHLAAAVRGEPRAVQALLGERQFTSGDGRLSALNLAFAQDGAVVRVPASAVVSDPIILVFVSAPKADGETSHIRNLISAGPHSRLTVIEHYIGTGGAAAFTNSVTDLVVGEGASVEHIKLQDEPCQSFHVATLQAQLASASQVICHSIALGARLARQNIEATLAGPHTEAVFNGLFLGHQERLIDHHLTVDHAAPDCASHEFFNGVLADGSKGVFYGHIHVRPHAQKTDAKQTNKNLLLSEQASVHTRPQLEIYADDVKCTHGATIGQLASEAIFYLRSRGVPFRTARQMLIHAFAGETIDRIRSEPARQALDRLVWQRIERDQHLGATH